MAVTTTLNADKALKDFFIQPLRQQLNEESGPFFAALTRNTENVEGGKIKMALQYGRHGGIGNRAEDGTLPSANPRKYIQAEWETKNLFAVLNISSKLIKASRSDQGAFTDMLKAQMKDLMSDAKDNIRRQYLSDGTGRVSTVALTADTDYVYDLDTGKVVINVTDSKFFYPGQFIDIIDVSADPDAILTGCEALEIVDVDYDNSTITVANGAAITCAEGDYIVFSGNLNMEITGIDAVFNADTLYGIDRTSNAWFKGNLIDNYDTDNTTEGILTEMVMQEAIDLCEEKLGSKIDYIQTTYGGARAYQYLQQTYKRNVEYMSLEGGYTAMGFSGVPIVKERYMPKGTMDFLSMQDFSLFALDDFDWMQKDGAILHRVGNTPVYQAVLEMYCDIGCAKPRGQARLYNFAEM